jgi:hypothetical protein
MPAGPGIEGCVDVTRGGARSMRKTAVLLAAGLAVLAGCARNAEIAKSPLAASSGHVSPPPVAVPRLPPGTFDQAAAQSDVNAAVAARIAGDAVAARRSSEAAIALWPANLAAWDELARDCRAVNDENCVGYAIFFHAKVEFVSNLPPRVGVLGFASLASAKLGDRSGNYVYDQRTFDTALRLASFYDEQDALRESRIPPGVLPKSDRNIDAQ